MNGELKTVIIDDKELVIGDKGIYESLENVEMPYYNIDTGSVGWGNDLIDWRSRHERFAPIEFYQPLEDEKLKIRYFGYYEWPNK